MDKKNVKKLIEYITKEPTEDEHKRGHKYPFMSAEILNAEISKILDFFLIPDSELEMKEKILKNIDNELSFSDDFQDSKQKSGGEASDLPKPEEPQNKADSEEFVDVVEEENENKQNEKAAENKAEEPEEALINEQEKNDENENNQQENSENNNSEGNAVENNQAEKTEEIKTLENKTEDNDKDLTEQAAKPEEDSEKIELLEFLLEFIEIEGELNYVLAGYFSKFFISLLNRGPLTVKIIIHFLC